MVAKKKIMIVDDNVDISKTLETLLEKEGYKLQVASNGAEFIKKVKPFNPDLVLLDVMMPGLTTKQILVKLNKLGLKKLKIILVTVVRFSEEERDEFIKKFSIVDYISKPFDIEDLLIRVKKQL